MSSRRSSRRQRSRSSQITRANNVLVFKLVDPIIQSLLFILFIYCLDSDTEIQYQLILTLIVGWQILSCIANLFFNPPDQLKKGRMAFLITIVLYMTCAHFFLTNVHEKVVVITLANNIPINVYESIIQTITMIISFWYYVICFREIRAMLTSVNNESA